jgi:hypothetical protein
MAQGAALSVAELFALHPVVGGKPIMYKLKDSLLVIVVVCLQSFVLQFPVYYVENRVIPPMFFPVELTNRDLAGGSRIHFC